jgi:hypothetical protein
MGWIKKTQGVKFIVFQAPTLVHFGLVSSAGKSRGSGTFYNRQVDRGEIVGLSLGPCTVLLKVTLRDRLAPVGERFDRERNRLQDISGL